MGRRAKLLSVSSFYRDTVASLVFPARQSSVVLNGADLNRVHAQEKSADSPFDFLTFGRDFG